MLVLVLVIVLVIVIDHLIIGETGRAMGPRRVLPCDDLKGARVFDYDYEHDYEHEHDGVALKLETL
ncbi:MAG: hypothetical protein FJY92_01880 [Candidatus Hydrogenedentes bacterium]|nr:hypothetical protein [Candidatus Hydrogenedentota bacterium]